jgi:hypothetical protein
MPLARTLLASAALAALAAPAAAVTYVFTLSDGLDGSWELPASPVPDTVFPDAFRINSVTGTLGASPFTTFMEFYLASSGGGVCADFACSLLDLYGPQLFSGSTAAPTFVPGSYAMTDVFGNPVARLTIAEAGGGGVIPEPATWAMLIAGFGLVGAGLRRRREAAVPA